MKNKALRWMLNASTLVVMLALAGVQDAEAQTKEFNISAQSATTGIPEFARQAGIQILVSEPLVRGKRISAVTGSHSIDEALTMLLKGTGLTATSKDGVTYTVAIAKTPSTTRNLPAASGGAQKNQSTGDASPGSAENGDSAGRLQEIVVTAQKRSERAFDVPISIVAVSGEELRKRNVTSLDDLSMVVPGMAVEQTGTNTRIFLRGVSNVSGTSSLVGMYLDEASVTSAGFSQLDLRTYDLERVEVLRGPQGTLYGEGSVGGTIRFITKDPKLDRFSMNADVATMFTEDGSPSQRVQEVLNVPLVENELAFRIAGEFSHDGGWIDQPAADRKDINGSNLTNIRVKGLWKPNAQFTANAMVVIERNDESQSTGEDNAGNFTQEFNLTTTPRVTNNYDLYNLTLSYEFSAARLLSTTTHVKQDIDTKDSGGPAQLLAPPAPPFDTYAPDDDRNSNITSEELRMTSLGAGPWKWTVGGFYRKFENDENAPVNYFDLPGPPGTPLPTPYSYQYTSLSKAWALFGDTSYEFADRLTLGAGLRSFHDSEDYTSGSEQGATFHALNPRVYAQYYLTDDLNIYASAAKGFRSGGFNLLNQPTYGPESVRTYEFGTKFSSLRGRLGGDVALFYSIYSDYQIFGQALPPNPPLAITSNAGRARIQGVEGSFDWRPMDEWTLGLNGTYAESKFLEINVGSTSHFVGDPLDLFPKYTAGVSVQRDFTWDTKPSFVRMDYTQHGRESYIVRSIGPWYMGESDVIRMLNFNIGLQWSPALSLSAFAQNLLNDRGFTSPLSIEGGAARPRPRTFGVAFGVVF